MPVVDLSHPVTDGMPVYPGDPQVTIATALSVETDGVAVARLDLGSHTGTHLDAPAHSIAGGRTVDRIPLELLMGRARVLRADGGAPGGTASGRRAIGGIDADDVRGGIPDRLPAIVLVATGWDRHFRSVEAVRHPHISPELARMLWERGARVLGVDMLSPDPTEPAGADAANDAAGVADDAADVADGAAGGPSKMPVHEYWLGGDGVIVENLTGLDGLPDTVEVALMPLRIEGGDGSPIRAIAVVG